MDPVQMVMLAVIGVTGGFMAGLVGIGGGIVIIPLLVYVANLSAISQVAVQIGPEKLATGISMVQAFFATVSGLLVHKKNRTVDWRLGFLLGGAGMIGGFIGSFGSANLSGHTLLTIYFCLILVAIGLMFRAPKGVENLDYRVNMPVAGILGLGVGALAGMLGVGGGFIMTPLMISVLKIPTRVAVGTSLLMILPTTIAGSIGKIATGQFDLAVAAIIIVGSITGAQFGARANARLSPRTVRTILTALLILIVIRTGYDLLIRAM